MFVEKPTMKKGSKANPMMKEKDGGMNTMKDHSKLLACKSLEPKQKNGREFFPNPKGK